MIKHRIENMDECLDIINDVKKKDLSVAELMQLKQKLQADLDKVTRLLREKIYKNT